ncbi:MAG: GCN5-related N-acetyltransferase [Bacteroidetes bacterium]|nr:GCN5-related N-acetyltransferase [Bacteroidota bacterium]
MLNFIFTPFPNLETERLLIRQMESRDRDMISDLRTNEQVLRFITGEHYPANVDLFITKMNEATQKQQQLIMWTIALKDNTPIGTISLGFISWKKGTAEVGCAMQLEYWSHGYMNEAAGAVMKYAFGVMKLKAICAYTHKDNLGSAKLLKKYGFILDEAVT